jgi:hypothetical protein
MISEPKNLFSPTRAALGARGAQPSNALSARVLRLTQMLSAVIGLLTLSSTALAQFNAVEPALPGSVEYSLSTSNYTWVRTSDPITVGTYVEDLISDSRLNQPVGRGAVGIVTLTGWDPDYNTMAAMVDFGRDYSAGIVFPELSAIQLVAIPEPSSCLLVLLFGGLLIRAGRGKLMVES